MNDHDTRSTQRHRWWLQEEVLPRTWQTFSSVPTRAVARLLVATQRYRNPDRSYRVLDTWHVQP